MKYVASCFYVMMIVGGIAISGEAQQGLTFSTLDHFPPYTWQDEGTATGIDVEIIQELAHRMGIPITIRFRPWKRVIQEIQDGDADGAFAAFKTPEREAFSRYLEPPLHHSTYKIFVNTGQEFPFETIEDVYGKTIGKNLGFHISDEFAQAEASNMIHVKEGKTMKQNVRMLNAGRVDGVIGNEQEVLYLLQQLGFSEMIVALPRPIREPRSAYLMISNAADIANKDQVIQQLSHTLYNMKTEGVFETIYAKYGK